MLSTVFAKFKVNEWKWKKKSNDLINKLSLCKVVDTNKKKWPVWCAISSQSECVIYRIKIDANGKNTFPHTHCNINVRTPVFHFIPKPWKKYSKNLFHFFLCLHKIENVSKLFYNNNKFFKVKIFWETKIKTAIKIQVFCETRNTANLFIQSHIYFE